MTEEVFQETLKKICGFWEDLSQLRPVYLPLDVAVPFGCSQVTGQWMVSDRNPPTFGDIILDHPDFQGQGFLNAATSSCGGGELFVPLWCQYSNSPPKSEDNSIQPSCPFARCHREQ